MNRSLLYPRATTTRRLIGLDGMWRFSFDPESKGVEAGWALDLPSSLSAGACLLLRPVHRQGLPRILR